MKGLYKGAVPTAITRVSFGAYVWGYEMTRRYLTGDSGEKVRERFTAAGIAIPQSVALTEMARQLSPLATLAAGGMAGTCFWLSNYPFDVVKNKMMVRACVRAVSFVLNQARELTVHMPHRRSDRRRRLILCHRATKACARAFARFGSRKAGKASLVVCPCAWYAYSSIDTRCICRVLPREMH